MSDELTAVVERVSRIDGVRGALIVEASAGVPVVAELTEGVAGDAVAALAASLYRRAATATSAATFGGLRSLQLEAEDGHVIVAGAGELLLVVVAERAAQLGLVRLEAARAAELLA